jgi:hypothetical protein
MHSLVEGEQRLDRHLLFSAIGKHEWQITPLDPALQRGMADSENPTCEPQGHGLAEFAFQGQVSEGSQRYSCRRFA